MAALLELGAGFHPDLTGRENVFLNGTLLGLKRSQISARFDEIVAFSEIERFIDTPVKHYSSGMTLRLSFAIAAHLDCDVLLIDEVLSVGDQNFAEKCLQRMRRLSDQGMTIILTSNNFETVTKFCPGRCCSTEDLSLQKASLRRSWIFTAIRKATGSHFPREDCRLGHGNSPTIRCSHGHCTEFGDWRQGETRPEISILLPTCNRTALMEAASMHCFASAPHEHSK